MVNLSDSVKLSCKIKQMLYNHAGVMCRIGVMNPVLRKMYESKQNKTSEINLETVHSRNYN